MVTNLRYWICVVLVAAAFGRARGEDPLEVTFEFGYNGVVPKSMRLIPVHVRIRNRLRNLQGRIELRQPSKRGSEVVAVKQIRSPSPSTQMFSLFPRVETSGGLDEFGLEAKVIFDDKAIEVFSKSLQRKIDKRVIITCGATKIFQANVDRRTQEAPNKSPVYTSVNYQFVPIVPLKLPEDVYGYDSVHALILCGSQFSKLSKRQIAAIHQWVLGGGRLMFFQPVSSPPLDKWLVSLGTAGTGEFVFKRVGLGLVCVQPFRTAQDLPFWLNKAKNKEAVAFLPEIVMGAEQLGLQVTRQPKGSGSFQILVNHFTRNTYGIRGFVWLVLIILGYIAVIGPLDWWVVNKTGKHWLSWPILGGGIAAFAIISYTYSGAVQSAPMTLVRGSVLDVGPDGGESRGEGCLWLHSTGNFDFDMEASREGTILSCRESATFDKSGAAGVTIENRQGQPSTLECRIPVFSSKEFHVAWRETGCKPVTVTDNEFVLPAEFVVKKAFLASEFGLVALKQKDQITWIRDKDRTGWRTLFKRFSGLVMSANPSQLSREDMITYWLGVSFSTLANRWLTQEDETDTKGSVQFLLSEWERSLDRSRYLRDGHRILVVFVEKPLNEVSLNRSIPQRVELDCIRFFLRKSSENPPEEP